MRKGKTVFLKVPKIQKDLVSVTVFGPGFGESIVIYIPYLGWGIIDSCLHKVKGNTINPALEYLVSEKRKRYPPFFPYPHPSTQRPFPRV